MKKDQVHQINRFRNQLNRQITQRNQIVRQKDRKKKWLNRDFIQHAREEMKFERWKQLLLTSTQTHILWWNTFELEQPFGLIHSILCKQLGNPSVKTYLKRNCFRLYIYDCGFNLKYSNTQIEYLGNRMLCRYLIR
jgi:hypothetical protein